MLKYRLKFTKLPKDFKKAKIIKKGTTYTLPEAERIYEETIAYLDQKNVDLTTIGQLSCEIISSDDDSLVFNLDAFNMEAPHLQDAISFDLQRSKMKLSDSDEDKKMLKYIESHEDAIMDEFNDTHYLEETIEEQKNNDVTPTETHSVDSIQKQQEEEAEYLSQLHDSSQETEIKSIDEEVIPHEVIPEIQDDEQLIEEEMIETRQERNHNQLPSQETIIDKQDFVNIESPDIKQSIEELEAVIKVPQSQGVEFMLEHLIIEPTDNDFIKNAKRQYLIDNFSDEELKKRETLTQQKIYQLLNDSNDALNRYYNQIATKDDQEKLHQKQEELKESIQQEYQVKRQHISEQNDKDYRISQEAMHQRHHQEMDELNNRHEKEKQELLSTYQNDSKDEIKSLEDHLNQRYETISQELSFESKVQLIQSQNADLLIGKENIHSQLLSKLNQYTLDNQEYLKQWTVQWNQKIQDKQPQFEEAYRLYQEDEDKKALKARQKDKEQREERQLRLSEDQVALEKEQLSQGLHQKDQEIERLKQQLESERQQHQQEQMNSAKRQNELMEIMNGQQSSLEKMNLNKDNHQGVSVKEVKKWAIAGVATALLGMGCVGFGVKNYYDHQQEQASQEQLQQAQEKKQKELESSLKEQQDQLKDLKKENESLSSENKEKDKKLKDAEKKAKEAEKKNKKDKD